MEKKTTRCCHLCHSTRSCTKEGLHTTTKFSSPTVIPQSHMLTHTTSSPPCNHGHLTTHLHNFISTMQPRPPHNSPIQPYLPLMHSQSPHNSPSCHYENTHTTTASLSHSQCPPITPETWSSFDPQLLSIQTSFPIATNIGLCERKCMWLSWIRWPIIDLL